MEKKAIHTHSRAHSVPQNTPALPQQNQRLIDFGYLVMTYQSPTDQHMATIPP